MTADDAAATIRLDADARAAIRTRAEAATPGPWVADVEWAAIAHGSDSVVHAWYSESCDVCGEPMQGDATVEVTPWDAAHIAGLDPPTVLALLDALDAAEAEAERLRTAGGAALDELQRVTRMLGDERAALAHLRDRIKALADEWQANGGGIRAARIRAVLNPAVPAHALVTHPTTPTDYTSHDDEDDEPAHYTRDEQDQR